MACVIADDFQELTHDVRLKMLKTQTNAFYDRTPFHSNIVHDIKLLSSKVVFIRFANEYGYKVATNNPKHTSRMCLSLSGADDSET